MKKNTSVLLIVVLISCSLVACQQAPITSENTVSKSTIQEVVNYTIYSENNSAESVLSEKKDQSTDFADASGLNINPISPIVTDSKALSSQTINFDGKQIEVHYKWTQMFCEKKELAVPLVIPKFISSC